MAKTTAAENLVKNYFLGGAQMPAPPATVEIALFTADPGEAGTGAEVSATGYARISVANDFVEFPESTSETAKANANDIDFGNAASDYGFITHFGVFHGATLMLYASLGSRQRDVLAGDPIFFPAGELLYTEE